MLISATRLGPAGDNATLTPAAEAPGATPVSTSHSTRQSSGGAVRWYVVQTRPNKEAFARSQLDARGIQVFLPRLQMPDYLQRNRPVVPLFPGYLFARLDLAHGFSVVAWAPGVKGFVGAGDAPAAVDEDVVAFLVGRATADGLLMARPALRTGDEVEICHGPFAGLVAIVQRPPDARGRIRVLMQLLNRRPISAQLPVRFLKSSWLA